MNFPRTILLDLRRLRRAAGRRVEHEGRINHAGLAPYCAPPCPCLVEVETASPSWVKRRSGVHPARSVWRCALAPGINRISSDCFSSRGTISEVLALRRCRRDVLLGRRRPPSGHFAICRRKHFLYVCRGKVALAGRCIWSRRPLHFGCGIRAPPLCCGAHGCRSRSRGQGFEPLRDADEVRPHHFNCCRSTANGFVFPVSGRAVGTVVKDRQGRRVWGEPVAGAQDGGSSFL